MPTEIYKKKHLENEFELIMINCRLYTISKYLKSKIYFGNLRLKYEIWADSDKPECSLDLCPRLNQNLDLDEIHEDSDDDKDNNKDMKDMNDMNDIKEEISSLNIRVYSLNININNLQEKLDYYDSTIRTATWFIVTMLLFVTILLYK